MSVPVLVIGVAFFFAIMGLMGLLSPVRIVSFFGTTELTTDGRNEVRAVYGGFGLAVAAVLVAALRAPTWGPGAFLAVSAALFGMAAGRLVSRAVDGSAGRSPWLFCVVELVLGGCLLFAYAERAT
jgi:hypothetical protein